MKKHCRVQTLQKERSEKDQNRRKYFQIESEVQQLWVEDVFAPDGQPEDNGHPGEISQEQAERGAWGISHGRSGEVGYTRLTYESFCAHNVGPSKIS
jgi:hypothetical protein